MREEERDMDFEDGGRRGMKLGFCGIDLWVKSTAREGKGRGERDAKLCLRLRF